MTMTTYERAMTRMSRATEVAEALALDFGGLTESDVFEHVEHVVGFTLNRAERREAFTAYERADRAEFARRMERFR
jgi:hypothetical protein